MIRAEELQIRADLALVASRPRGRTEGMCSIKRMTGYRLKEEETAGGKIADVGVMIVGDKSPLVIGVDR